MKKTVLFGIFGIILLTVVWRIWPKQKQAPTDQYTDIVTTSAGELRGFVQDGLNVYLGIPYAKAPTGSLRFKAPQPAAKWNGIFEAYEFGPLCPQLYDPVEVDDPHEKLNNEDCLKLNIWVPAGGNGNKAVMVFIHGGGFVSGYSKESLYNGTYLAKTGDVIVVNLNYRLGLLGYLDFSVFGGQEYADSANNGLHDQLMALQWVQDNILAFGGDPANVTVFGESAGGASVTALLGIDSPQQYFKRLIAMSASPLHTAEVSNSIATMIRDESGIKPALVWKYAPTAGITYIQDQVLKALGSPLSDLTFAPTYSENNIVKRTPFESAQQGKTQGIDLMIGTMANEMTYWEWYDTETDHICDQTVKDNLVTYLDPAQSSAVEELYRLYQQNPERAGETEGEILLDIEGDYVFRVPAIQLAEAQSKNGSTYLYRMEYPVNLPDHPCQDNRSPHGSELPFLFGKINEPAGTDFIGIARNAQDSADRQRLMNQLVMAWTNFAKTGNPNGDGFPDWQLFEAGTQPTMRFGINTRAESAPFYQEYLAMANFMQSFDVFDALK